MSLCLSREYLTRLNNRENLFGRGTVSQSPRFKSEHSGHSVSELSEVPAELWRVSVSVSREMTVQISAHWWTTRQQGDFQNDVTGAVSTLRQAPHQGFEGRCNTHAVIRVSKLLPTSH